MTRSVGADQRRVQEAIARAIGALRQREGALSLAEIATLLGVGEETLRSYVQGRRNPKPEFVRLLAERSGLRVVELFAALGWLPSHEIVPADPLRVVEQVAAAATTFAAVVPHVRRALASLDASAPAPAAAAQALLASLPGARRFDVRLSRVISSGRYCAVTNVVADFRLRPGQAPLVDAEADRLADQLGLAQRPDSATRRKDPAFWNTRIELRAWVDGALRQFDVGQYSWQGEPGTTTWRDAADSYPAHLLVQDTLGGAGWPSATNPWQPQRPDTLVFVGSRSSAGPAAAVVAEALGWQFVPVRSDVEITGDGYVFQVRREKVPGRLVAWDNVARHIERRYRGGDPWPAVLLVRPSAFLGPDDTVDRGAVALLRDTPARVVYARSPRSFLAWWARRQVGSGRADLDVEEWVRAREKVQAAVEQTIVGRARDGDLALALPEVTDELVASSAQVPGSVVDAYARVAWTVLRWLSETPCSHGGSLLDRVRPGTLATWIPELIAGHEPLLQRLPQGGSVPGQRST